MPVNPVQSVSYNPLDPQGSAMLGQAMLKAQLQQQLAQQMMEQGSQQPDPNAYIPGNSEAPARVIKENPIGGLARALQQGVGAYTQKQSMQQQLALQQAMMQRQFGMINDTMGGGQSGQYPPGYVFPSKEAAEGAPLSAGGFTSQGGSSPGGDTLKKAMLLSMMGASPEVVKGVIDYGSPTPGMKDAGASGLGSPLAYSNATAQGSAAASAGEKVQPITGPDGSTRMMTDAQIAAQAQGAPQSGNMTPQGPQAPQGLTPQERGIEVGKMAPPQSNGVQIPPGASVGGAPLSPEMVNATGNAVNQATQGFQVQSPAAAAGQKQDFTNAADYKNGLINQVSEGEKAQRIINAQEGLLDKFKSGAWTSQKAEIANAAASMGASQDVVQKIAGGDPAAVQAFEGMASQHALLQLKSLMNTGGGSGRVGQQEFIQFKNDLASPDKMEGAIRAINNLQRQSYQDSTNELGALSDWEKQGKPINQFRENYAQEMSKKLSSPQAPAASSQYQEGMTAVNKQTGQRLTYRNGQWQ